MAACLAKSGDEAEAKGDAKMKVRDLTELAARNLHEAVLRNSLTTIGIAVGVASLVAMLSLGVGLQQLINRRLERTGLFDSVLVRPGNAFGAPAQGGGGFPGGRRLAQCSNGP